VTATVIAEGLTLTAPVERPGGIIGLMTRRIDLPTERQFELDEVGAEVWNLCDGKTTVASITKRLQDRYKMNRFEAEAALTAYLQTLQRRKLIQLLVKSK
jgi:hypothetical protein